MSVLEWMSAVECPTDNLMHKIKAIGKEDKNPISHSKIVYASESLA